MKFSCGWGSDGLVWFGLFVHRNKKKPFWLGVLLLLQFTHSPFEVHPGVNESRSVGGSSEEGAVVGVNPLFNKHIAWEQHNQQRSLQVLSVSTGCPDAGTKV